MGRVEFIVWMRKCVVGAGARGRRGGGRGRGKGERGKREEEEKEMGKSIVEAWRLHKV